MERLVHSAVTSLFRVNVAARERFFQIYLWMRSVHWSGGI